VTERSFALLGSGEFGPWTADVDRWLHERTTRTGPVLIDDGLAYAGCSAGIAALGVRAPDSSVRGFSRNVWRQGLGLFPRTLFGPHWDVVDRYVPGAAKKIEAALPSGARLFAIDENTAAIGDGRAWSVVGAGNVAILENAVWQRFPAAPRSSATPPATRRRRRR
jgi:cyanophycinase-like exopeptidase